MADTPADHERRLELRKYPNRRYYDATRSRHVTLEEIQSLIQEGYEIRVTDSKSGEDITGKVLAQILLEFDPPKLDVFPVPLLHRLIRANEQLVRDFVEKYFNQALHSFLDSQRQFEGYLRRTMGLAAGGPGMMDWSRLMINPFTPPFWGMGPPPPGHPADSPESASVPEPPQTQQLQDEVRQLRQQLQELQDRLRPTDNHQAREPG